MTLDEQAKAHIDSLTYSQLLAGVRFKPSGDPWMQGETGDYWLARMGELRAKPGGDSMHVAASKRIGWDARDD